MWKITMGRATRLLANQQPHIILAVLTIALVLPASSFKIVQIRSSYDGAPQRPEHFRNIDELNKYLSELTDYYTVLGRPRFGKRSESPSEKQALGYGYDAGRVADQTGDADPRVSLALAELLLSPYDRER